MSDAEIARQLFIDIPFVMRKLLSFSSLYNRIRSRGKIARDLDYPVVFTSKSPDGNLWYFVLSKDSYYKNFKQNRIGASYFTSYQSREGFRLFKLIPTPDGSFSGIAVYNAHTFYRYSERLQLGLSKIMDIAIHFFKHNLSNYGTVMNQTGMPKYAGVCKAGYLLGSYKQILLLDKHPVNWIMYKTFISDKEVTQDQIVDFSELKSQLEEHVAESLDDEVFDKLNYQSLVATLNSLRQE